MSIACIGKIFSRWNLLWYFSIVPPCFVSVFHLSLHGRNLALCIGTIGTRIFRRLPCPSKFRNNCRMDNEWFILVPLFIHNTFSSLLIRNFTVSMNFVMLDDAKILRWRLTLPFGTFFRLYFWGLFCFALFFHLVYACKTNILFSGRWKGKENIRKWNPSRLF